MFTPIQRADRLIGGHDLERLVRICKNQKSISTAKVLVELKRVRTLISRHGVVMKELGHQVKGREDRDNVAAYAAITGKAPQ